jgi:hypothetical protein
MVTVLVDEVDDPVSITQGEGVKENGNDNAPVDPVSGRGSVHGG